MYMHRHNFYCNIISRNEEYFGSQHVNRRLPDDWVRCGIAAFTDFGDWVNAEIYHYFCLYFATSSNMNILAGFLYVPSVHFSSIRIDANWNYLFKITSETIIWFCMTSWAMLPLWYGHMGGMRLRTYFAAENRVVTWRCGDRTVSK